MGGGSAGLCMGGVGVVAGLQECVCVVCSGATAVHLCLFSGTTPILVSTLCLCSVCCVSSCFSFLLFGLLISVPRKHTSYTTQNHVAQCDMCNRKTTTCNSKQCIVCHDTFLYIVHHDPFSHNYSTIAPPPAAAPT